MTDAQEQEREKVAIIGIVCSCLDGMERTRIAMSNRRAQVMRSEPDEDGVIRGFGMSEDSPLVKALTKAVKGVQLEEDRLTRSLEAHMKLHPLAPFVEVRKGIGWKTFGRLIGAIGDPYLRTIVAEDGTWTQVPRTLWQLYALCGMSIRPDGVAPYRKRGEIANWSERARKVLYTIAFAQRYSKDNYYRPVYDEAKERAKQAVHRVPCVRCGPSGKPKAIGTPLNASHTEARAFRMVSKQLLTDAWFASRALHAAHGITDDFKDPERSVLTVRPRPDEVQPEVQKLTLEQAAEVLALETQFRM